MVERSLKVKPPEWSAPQSAQPLQAKVICNRVSAMSKSAADL